MKIEITFRAEPDDTDEYRQLDGKILRMDGARDLTLGVADLPGGGHASTATFVTGSPTTLAWAPGQAELKLALGAAPLPLLAAATPGSTLDDDPAIHALLAALVASVALSLGSSIYEIVSKELVLSSIGQDSQYAFYAADTAAGGDVAYREDENAARVAADLEAVFDVPVQVSAVLGRSKMEVGELLKLGPGTVLELDRRVGEAIDIFVNNRLVARGEIVVVDERLGVTMTEIIKDGDAG